MLIRPARPVDTAALSEIAQRAKACWGYSPAQLALWRADLTMDAAALAAGPAFVGELDGTIAGFYQLGLEHGSAALTHLWVDPWAMRRGLGRALMQHAARHAAAAGAGCLLIDADPYAAPFYHACGARLANELPAPIAGQPDRVRPQFILALHSPTVPAPATDESSS